jgi:hypothetical protein
MDENQQKRFLHFLVRQVKELYPENLLYRAFAERLRELGYQDVDTILEDARQSRANRAKCEAYLHGLDELIPPFHEDIENQAFVELIQRLGLDRQDPN